jgi:Tol biopolymer transport system component
MRVTKAKYGASQPVWSPDGRSILYTSSIPLSVVEGELPWRYERPGRKQNDEVNWENNIGFRKKERCQFA